MFLTFLGYFITETQSRKILEKCGAASCRILLIRDVQYYLKTLKKTMKTNLHWKWSKSRILLQHYRDTPCFSRRWRWDGGARDLWTDWTRGAMRISVPLCRGTGCSRASGPSHNSSPHQTGLSPTKKKSVVHLYMYTQRYTKENNLGFNTNTLFSKTCLIRHLCNPLFVFIFPRELSMLFYSVYI